MDAVPVSFVLTLFTPVTEPATGRPSALAAQIFTARQALGTAPREEGILHYVAMLWTLASVDHDQGVWTSILACASRFEWVSATQQQPVRPTRIDVEIRFALSLLCSTLASQGEAAAKRFLATEAQITFSKCACAFDILHAFLATRTTGPAAQREEPRARAIMARLFARQSQFAALVKLGDKEQYAVGLDLAAAYWRLSQTDLTRVPTCATFAEGYAHYTLMVCANNKARTFGSLESLHSDHVQLAHLEQLLGLAALEGERAATIFAKSPSMHEACTNCSKEALRQQQQVHEARYKWLLILSQKEDDVARPGTLNTEDVAAVFAQQIQSDLFQVSSTASAPLSPPPLDKNELWTRLVRAAQAWLLLQGGRDGLRRALTPIAAAAAAAATPQRPANVDVPQQMRADIGVDKLVLSKRDEVALALGRMSERLQWLQHESSSGAPVLPTEIDDVRAVIEQLADLLRTMHVERK